MVLDPRETTQTAGTRHVAGETERRAETGRVAAEADNRTAGDLMRQLSEEASMLIRQEIDLAKLEMTEKIKRMARGIIWIAIGAAVGYAGLLALVQTAIDGLGIGLWTGLPLYIAAWLSPLIIAVAVLIIAAVMIQGGVSKLKKQSIVPEKTLETMRENKQWLEKQIR